MLMRSAAALALVLAASAPAHAAPAETLRQIALTDQQVSAFLAAQADIAPLAKRMEAAGDKPDPALQADLDTIAKKHGFADFDDLNTVAGNISLVMAGLNPETGTFTDPIAGLKQDLANVIADTSIPEADKSKIVEQLNDAIAHTPPLEHQENVEIVKKHQKEIEKAFP